MTWNKARYNSGLLRFRASSRATLQAGRLSRQAHDTCTVRSLVSTFGDGLGFSFCHGVGPAHRLASGSQLLRHTGATGLDVPLAVPGVAGHRSGLLDARCPAGHAFRMARNRGFGFCIRHVRSPCGGWREDFTAGFAPRGGVGDGRHPRPEIARSSCCLPRAVRSRWGATCAPSFDRPWRRRSAWPCAQPDPTQARERDWLN